MIGSVPELVEQTEKLIADGELRIATAIYYPLPLHLQQVYKPLATRPVISRKASVPPMKSFLCRCILSSKIKISSILPGKSDYSTSGKKEKGLNVVNSIKA
jgi:hypothetical protein